MSKKNFYAVRKGRAPGVYSQWSGPGGAEEQVKGYPGAIFKGFDSHKEAEHYLQSGDSYPTANQTWTELMDSPVQTSPTNDYRDDLAAGKVVIFTDGASTGNPGRGGYGAVLLFGDTRKELSGGFRRTTNNRMELLACIMALRELKRPAPAIIYSDSRYVVNAIEKGWARRWQRNDWMRPPYQGEPSQMAENSDLWAELLALLDCIPVTFRWVKGHASHPENERCDQLAVQAARGKNLPADSGFEKMD